MVPELVMRAAGERDVRFMQSLEAAPDARRWVDAWSAERFRRCLRAHDEALFIVEHGGRRVGFVVIDGFGQGGDLQLTRLVLLEAVPGMAGQAISSILGLCLNCLGAARVWLYVQLEHQRARRLYCRHGFQEHRVAGQQVAMVATLR